MSNIKTPKVLINASRQYQHNDCSGLVFGFDYEETVSIVRNLQQELGLMRIELDHKSKLLKSCEAALVERDRHVTKLIQERDTWEENATQLAGEIARLFEIDFGEFSNCNDPVENALAHITDMNNAKAV